MRRVRYGSAGKRVGDATGIPGEENDVIQANSIPNMVGGQTDRESHSYGRRKVCPVCKRRISNKGECCRNCLTEWKKRKARAKALVQRFLELYEAEEWDAIVWRAE